MGIYPDGMEPVTPGTAEAEDYLWSMEVKRHVKESEFCNWLRRGRVWNLLTTMDLKPTMRSSWTMAT